MAYTTQTVLEGITAGYRLLTMIDEVTPPSAEQTTVGLEVFNDMMLNLDADGIRLGWYPQNNVANIMPLQDIDVRNVKLLLASELANHYGIEIGQTLAAKIDAAIRQLSKRAIEYFESDLTGLPFAQGGLFGPGRI